MSDFKNIIFFLAVLTIIVASGVLFHPINSQAACAPGYADCDCNSGNGCETNIDSDSSNCGACGKVCQDTTCSNGSCNVTAPNMTGGIVPCGRLLDDPNTPYDEQEPCTLCHIFVMFQIITTFIFEISGIIAVFFLVVGGLIYATSAGDRSRMETGKQAVKWTIFGIFIIILSWLIVTVVLTTLGYVDPLGGQWDVVANCNLKPGTATGPQIYSYCGDERVQSPNTSGFAEQCEANESYANFNTRTGGTQQLWVETIYRCKSDCTLGCAAATNIGQGCYLDLNGNGATDSTECQKGKYVCNFATDTAVCADIFSDVAYKGTPQYQACPEIDYCCSTAGNPTASQKAAAATYAKFAPVRLDPLCIGQYPSPTWSTQIAAQTYINNNGLGAIYSPTLISNPPSGYFQYFMGCKAQTCDAVCKIQGKTCVGVGEYTTMNCIFSAHDVGSGLCPGKYGCDWNTNGVTGDCKATDSQLNYPGSVACVDPGEYAANGSSCAGLKDIWIGSTWCYCK